MNFREMNLRIFEGKPIPHVLFQPRFEPWFAWHKILFHPRLVLGVSDEIPEGADEEAMIRLGMVSDWCRSRTFPVGV